MSNVVLTIPTPQVVVSDGRAFTAATVTNTTDAEVRVVLGVFAPVAPTAGTVPPSAAGWTQVERPVREIRPGATEQFGITFATPEGTAPGSYAVRLIAYAADGAPEESADQAHRIDVVVPAAAPPPPAPRVPWWVYVVAAVLLVAVGTVAFLLLRPSGQPCTGTGCAGSSAPPSSAPPSSAPVAVEGITWTLTGFSDGTATTAAVPGHEATLVVQGDSVSGSTGCNRYNASWARDGDQVQISNVVSTLILCTDASVRQQEQQFLGILKDTATLSADQNTLTLATADGRSLVFTR